MTYQLYPYVPVLKENHSELNFSQPKNKSKSLFQEKGIHCEKKKKNSREEENHKNSRVDVQIRF